MRGFESYPKTVVEEAKSDYSNKSSAVGFVTDVTGTEGATTKTDGVTDNEHLGEA